MGDSIQVPGGTQEEYVRHAQARKDAGLERISTILKWTAGIVLFMAVLIAAGIRGYYAYNHLPATQVDFNLRNSVPYPAVTLCPLRPSSLVLVECVKLTSYLDTGDCTATSFIRPYLYNGYIANCYVLNDPQDGSTPMSSTSVMDVLHIEVSFVNTSDIIEGDPIGVYVLLHPQMTTPSFEIDSTFEAGAGQWTQAWILLNEVHSINGNIVNDYQSSSSSMPAKENTYGTYANIVSIGIAFTVPGVFVNQEYYTYTPDNWIGEVGGLAFLLYMLHWVFTESLLWVLARLRKK